MPSVSDTRTGRPPEAPLVMKWAAFLAAAGVVGWVCLLVLRPFMSVIAWSAVLAITCHPLYERLVRRSARPARSALVTSAVMVLAVLVPIVFIAAMAITQLTALAASVGRSPVDSEGMGRRIAAAFEPIARRFGLDTDAVLAWAQQHASNWIASAGQYTMSAAATIGGSLLAFGFTVVGTYLLLRHGEALVAAIPALLPFDRTRSEALLLRIRDVIYACMYGVVAIAAIQGVLCGGMFWVLGVPAAALWGLVTVFASLVPLVGTAVVWIPGSVYLLMTGAWLKALVLAVWGLAVVSSVDNILRPRLVASRVRLSGMAMFVAMLGGLQAFGALGIVLGPTVFALAAAIVDLLRETQGTETASDQATSRGAALDLVQPADSSANAAPE